MESYESITSTRQQERPDVDKCTEKLLPVSRAHAEEEERAREELVLKIFQKPVVLARDISFIKNTYFAKFMKNILKIHSFFS